MRRHDRIGLRHALRGLAAAWREQPNLRIETAVGLVALALAAGLGVSAVPVLLSCALVLSAELLNTAIEAVVDLTSPDPHPLAGRAKDVSAGAVLVAAGISVAVGLVHLGPPLAARLAKGPA